MRKNILIPSLLTILISGFAWAEGDAAPDAAVDAEGSAEQEPSTEKESSTDALSVEDILKRDPELSDYVDEERCVSKHRIRRFDVIDDRHIAVQVSRDDYYLIQFKNRCIGLAPGKTVMQEARNSRLCVHDSIRAMDQWGFGRMRPGPPCFIPGFQSITREQLLHIKDTLKAEKRKKREERKNKQA